MKGLYSFLRVYVTLCMSQTLIYGLQNAIVYQVPNVVHKCRHSTLSVQL